ncbi:MAG TPA: replication-relaxation family protein [Candidatus Sulfotelmatobacter sp.]|jgi:hypothetical protein|nr:replication-relaxation family protein [Candidatus Sulfotelmatobacter sp.]
MQQQTHKPLTKKQQEILFFLYRFRFLNTHHFQIFLNHKDPRRIQKWLKELTTNGYLLCFYDSTTITGRAIPAVYGLEAPSRHVLKENPDCDPLLLREIYKEKKRTQGFREHCLFLAEVYFLFLKEAKENNETFHFSTKVDLIGYQHFPHPLPDAYLVFMKRGKKRQRYFLEIIDPQTPWFVINARVQKYMTYFEEGTWHENAALPIPSVLFVCIHPRSIRYLKKAIKVAYEESYETDIPFFMTTQDKIRGTGLHSLLWQKEERADTD